MRIKVTNDLLFKKVLSSEENKDITQGFINDFCGLDVACEDIHIMNPYSIELYKNALNNKKQLLSLIERDISIELSSLDVLVELQMYRDIHFIARTLHYTFERFSENYGVPGKMTMDTSGDFDKYSSLKPVYSVNIVSEKLFKRDNDALREFLFYDKEHDVGLDKDWIKLVFLELSKSEFGSKNKKQQYWYEFFKTGKAHDDAPEYIRRAENVTDFANMSKEERDVITELERAEEKRRSIYATAMEDGAEGERLIWQAVVADKDALIVDKDARIAELEAMLKNQAENK